MIDGQPVRNEADIFSGSPDETDIKLDNFEKYVRRQALSRFLVRYELFKMQQNIKGSIVECGVHNGGGLFAWAKLSSMLEPYAIHRKVVGFDTFSGFPDISDKDLSKDNPDLKQGGFKANVNIYDELQELRDAYDDNRFLNQFDKIELVKGDATKTIKRYINNNPHILISLLFLDFDLYEPTKVALENFLPRMPKGSILAFDEINNENWAGETLALLESLKINNLEIRKFSFDPNIAYTVL